MVNDMLERTVDYAVADAVDYAMRQIVFIPEVADIRALSRRYANGIASLNVVPFSLTHAFLDASLVNQGLLLNHSLDFVNPFWAIEIYSHGLFNLQRTYRVTGWQRTVNTNAVEFFVNLMPDAALNVADFLTIESYVLLRFGADMIAGTYEGISNFNMDSFTAALPAITWAAAQRALADMRP